MSETTQVEDRPAIPDGTSGGGDAGAVGSGEAPQSRWVSAWALLAVAVVAGVIGWLIGRGGLSPDDAGLPEQAVVTDDALPRIEPEDPSPFFGQFPDEVPPAVREFFESLPRDLGELRGTEPGRFFEDFFEGDRFSDFFGPDFGITGPDELLDQLDELRDGLGFDFGGLGLVPEVPPGYQLGDRNLRVEIVDGQIEFTWSLVAGGPDGEVAIEVRNGAIEPAGEEIDLDGVVGYQTDDGISWEIGAGRATVSISSGDLSESELAEFATVVAEGLR